MYIIGTLLCRRWQRLRYSCPGIVCGLRQWFRFQRFRCQSLNGHGFLDRLRVLNRLLGQWWRNLRFKRQGCTLTRHWLWRWLLLLLQLLRRSRSLSHRILHCRGLNHLLTNKSCLCNSIMDRQRLRYRHIRWPWLDDRVLDRDRFRHSLVQRYIAMLCCRKHGHILLVRRRVSRSMCVGWQSRWLRHMLRLKHICCEGSRLLSGQVHRHMWRRNHLRFIHHRLLD